MSRIDHQISWVYAEDVGPAYQFYEETLGLELALDEGPARIYRLSVHSSIGVCKVFEGRACNPAGSMISIVTDDVDGWYERLSAAGARLRGKPHKLPQFNIYTFFAEDPNGYVLEFQQFLSPGWVTAGRAQA